jgi:hypothetical protein
MCFIFNLVCNNILQKVCLKLHFILEAKHLMHMCICVCVCVYICKYIVLHSKIMMIHVYEHLSSLCCIYISLLLRISLCM